MQGLDDFIIHDETYKDFYVSPDVKVLLTTDSPLGDPEIAWISEYGKSPVFYLQLGHDSKAWKNPGFKKVLYNGIHWANNAVKKN